MSKLLKIPKLSAIILNHNTVNLLKQCLESFPKKTEAEIEIIAIDAASTDGSVDMVKKHFPGVILIESATNPGFTKGNNLARGKARGEYVLFLNSDTKLSPDTLEVMVKFMDSDPSIGISTCLTLLPSGKLYYACHRGFPSPWNSLAYFSGLAKLFPNSRLFSGYTASYLPIDKIHEIDACSGTFLLIRKNLLDQIGWLDEDYFSYGEDLEMCYQAKSRGYKVMFNPRTKIIHYWGASSGLKSTSRSVSRADPENKKRWEKARYEAMKIFYDKHYKNQYPSFFRYLVFSAISAMSQIRKYSD